MNIPFTHCCNLFYQDKFQCSAPQRCTGKLITRWCKVFRDKHKLAWCYGGRDCVQSFAKIILFIMLTCKSRMLCIKHQIQTQSNCSCSDWCRWIGWKLHLITIWLLLVRCCLLNTGFRRETAVHAVSWSMHFNHLIRLDRTQDSIIRYLLVYSTPDWSRVIFGVEYWH